MTDATWGDAATPAIDWRMSAALENVPRGPEELAEVTNLKKAVADWAALDPEHKANAVLTFERSLLLEGVTTAEIRGEAIGTLAEMLSEAGSDEDLSSRDRDVE